MLATCDYVRRGRGNALRLFSFALLQKYFDPMIILHLSILLLIYMRSLILHTWQGMFPRERLARTLSAQQASSSHHLLRALEDGGIEDVRAVLLNTPEGLMRSALLSASYDCRHALRTPLMAAARTGSYAISTTIMNSIDRLFSRSRVSTPQCRNAERDTETGRRHASSGRTHRRRHFGPYV